MRTFSTSGTGSGQTLSEIESDKMPIYDSLTDVEADLANLSVGQIVATKDTGSELSAPVDTVQSGNMHAVTSNAVAESLSYSTTEHKTGKKWIDGKPTYEKTIDCGVLPNSTTKFVAHGINNLKKVIKSEGYSDNNAGTHIPVPYVSGNPLAMSVDTTNILIQTSSNYSNFINTQVTIEYTKTTD